MRTRMRSSHIRESTRLELRRKLPADAIGSCRIGEEHRPEGDVLRTGGDKVEDVPAALDAAHPDDREARRGVARMHGGECDRLQRGAGEAASACL